jgi:hypothetical protein
VKRIYVDFSVFIPKRAEGFVYGVLELPQVPREGETLSFESPRNSVPPPAIAGFVPRLVVDHVLTAKGAGPEDVALSLADVEVATSPDAERIFAYFERGFGLDIDRHPGQRNA